MSDLMMPPLLSMLPILLGAGPGSHAAFSSSPAELEGRLEVSCMAVLMTCHTRIPFNTICTSVPARLMLSCMQDFVLSILARAGLLEGPWMCCNANEA